MRAPALLPPALLTCCGWLLAPVNSVHPECRFHLEIQEEETKCAELLRTQTEKYKGSHSSRWLPRWTGQLQTATKIGILGPFRSPVEPPLPQLKMGSLTPGFLQP
ncbi:vasoactive intestinal polypeptide receptor 2-like isoform X3 [Ailuropoda melanoleuca]|uniref:vasoactive intestinal polypeptide receptor 2-like isoform X3 n=1 Tax=Ailuropoda melanoleuca TaxID=9646 RepID=UPI0014950665|nr:vasoactive intestinal polypeptide receptor 2-like isoform X3 [Ailuropoda melanoleuca]